MGTNSQCTGKD